MMATIEMPREAGEWERTVVGDRAVYVLAEYDGDCENPLESCDAMGRIRSLGRRHSNRISPEEFEELTGFDPRTGEFEGGSDRDAVALSYYEHGNHVWFVKGETPAGVEYLWDGVRVAGLWQPDEALLAEVKGLRKAARREKMVEFARQACALYTTWGNGECYGYRVAVGPADEDDPDGAEEVDSCWGFVGWDSVVEAAREAAETALYTDAKVPAEYRGDA